MIENEANILIVEDESLVALEIEQYLNKYNFTTLPIVTSGEEALFQIVHNRVDLVLMDIKLNGEMDGIATGNAIREFYKIPVIFITAYSDEKTINRVKKTDPFGYIVKPFKKEDLKANVKVALYKRKKEENLTSKASSLSNNKLPINSEKKIILCPYCKKYLNRKKNWRSIEKLIKERFSADYGHCTCPDCVSRLISEFKELLYEKPKHRIN